MALLVVLLAGAWADLSAAHWTAVLLCCMLVISLELVNTAVEQLCDKVCPEPDPHIRRAKDAAAGAVLVSAVGSVAVAGVILMSDEAYRANLCAHFSGPGVKAGLAAGLIASLLFIFAPSLGQRK